MEHIRLPIPQKVSSNKIYSGLHWATRKKIADLYHECLIVAKGKKIKTWPVDIEYVFTFKARPLDTTNCFFMAKMLEDGLIKWGVLPDDSPKFVSSTTIQSTKGNKDEVEILISKTPLKAPSPR